MTVIAPCYNHERFVRECLESIRMQDYPNLQIIVTDDCSKDASPSVIREWIKANPSLQVTFIQSKKNRGLCSVLNDALKVATGKYIAMTNTDDVWKPSKIRKQMEFMESLPEKTAVLYSDAYLMDENGALLPKRFIESYRSFDHMPEGDIHEVMWNGNFIPVMTTLIRRSAFEKVGLHDESLFYEDWDLWLRISKDFHFAYYPFPTARYRIVTASMAHSGVDRIRLSDEIIFTKNLLNGSIPKSVRNKAFNYAVRRIFRRKETNPEEGLE
ncbi:MAG TPA: glycosyltransferase, partial [Phycisphaerae bacterium]|nr:glycosyltransferase [Phycisphaerae bacterium]